MKSWFQNFITPPVFDSDEEKTLKAGLIHSITLITMFFFAVLIVGNLLGGRTPVGAIMINAAALIITALFHIWLHSGKVNEVALGIATCGFIIITMGIISLGTVRTPTTSFYLFLIVCIGVVFGSMGLAVASTASSLAVFGLILAENAELLAKPDYTVTITQWISFTALFGLTAGLVYQTNHITRTALLRAKNEIAERKRSEEALQKANTELYLHLDEIERLQAELQAQSLHDPLTGLLNRRNLYETIDREVTRIERENSYLSVIIADADNFKAINDSYGHQVGDRFLIEIAELLKSNSRGSDIVCRYGGEEFLLVMPGVAPDYAVARAEEIRRKCAQMVIPQGDKNVSVTLSFGTATFPTHGKEIRAIITKADKALYYSKQHGRNRVTSWSDFELTGTTLDAETLPGQTQASEPPTPPTSKPPE